MSDYSDNDHDDSEEEGHDEDEIEDLFPFLPEEADLVLEIAARVRRSLSSLDPPTLRKMSTFIFALERLPYPTAGVSMDLGVVERADGGSRYVSVEITERAFRLMRGGSEYSPEVGSDSYSNMDVQIEIGGFREGSPDEFREWLDAFRTAGGTYSLVDNGDDPDLSADAPTDGWDRLARYWNAN